METQDSYMISTRNCSFYFDAYVHGAIDRRRVLSIRRQSMPSGA
jgi:hypothetical protein